MTRKTPEPNGRFPRTTALALVAGCGLLGLALSRWDPLGSQSILCRHRDDPTGRIDFRVDVGRGKDRVRFADGQTLPVKSSRDRITFLEKESNNFHLADNDGDEVALGHAPTSQQLPGIAAVKPPTVLHPDQHHDVEHHTTIDRRALTFEEHALEKGGGLGVLMMDGRCRLVAAG
ncbi:hypothetical protein L107_00105 [Cyanobium sp. Copco_Reservoir_LC18]|uniref:hypothetical protein n=1 Tax=Cyanobium sp. Copco_Reservoir_LC18 TaxID=1328305 RepID=UPI00135884C5|nr:hypothetical protein [Cyanobium sp. Copco_Reservoir_LC18]KAF0655124.1 hypothetical protein L107_00105 [Cyanobium sp. Copco_Reservoir_LC18]